jgi:MFS family permease
MNLLEDEEMTEKQPLLSPSPARGRTSVGSVTSDGPDGDDVPAVIPSPAVRRKSQTQQDDEDDEGTSFSVSKFFEIMNRELLLAGGFLCLGFMLFGFVEPIYAIHAANEVHLTPLTIGSMYFVLAGSYCVSGAPLGNLGDSRGYVRVMLAGAVVSCLCLIAMMVNNETFLVSQRDVDEGRFISTLLPRSAVAHGVGNVGATGNSTSLLSTSADMYTEHEDHVSAFAALTHNPFERFTTEPMLRSLIKPQWAPTDVKASHVAMIHTDNSNSNSNYHIPTGTEAKQPWLYSQTGHLIEIIVLFFWGIGVAACVVPAMPAMKDATKALQGIIDARNLAKKGLGPSATPCRTASQRAAAELVAKLDRGDQSSLHQLDTTIKSHEELTEYLVALSCIFAELGMLLGAILGAIMNEYFGFSLTMLCGALICAAYVGMALYYYTRFYPSAIRAKSKRSGISKEC